MKTGFYVFALFSFLIPSTLFAKVTVTKTDIADIYDFQIENVQFEKTDMQGFNKAKLVGVQGYEAINYRLGHPELPVVRLYVDGDVQVSVEDKTLDSLNIQKVPAKIMPSQRSHSKAMNAKKPAFILNNAAYNSAFFSPGKFYEVKDAGSVRGRAQKLVTLYPFQYNAVDGQYKLIKNYRVAVKNTSKASNTFTTEVFAFVVGEKFKDSVALKNYIALKQSLGYAVEIINVVKSDSAEKIRGQLQKIYKDTNGSLKYALIIGDSGDVSAHKSSIISGRTDHYFAAIDTDSYITDINAPDIGVGRIAVANNEQLAAVLEKYTRYQVGAFSQESWLSGAAFLATNDRYQIAEGSHNYAIDTYTSELGYLGFFPEENQAGGDKVYAITYKATHEDTQKVLAAGRTIINYSGHGATTFWDSPEVTQDDVRALSDPDAMPFVISNACITADYRVAESFAETWQRHPFGAIAFWGSMDSSYWDEDDILERRMYDGIYGNGKLQFFALTSHALAEVWKHYNGAGLSKFYWETYHVFGDPSISLRTTHVQKASIIPNQPITIGASDAVYSLKTEEGNALIGVRAALLDAGGKIIQITYSDAEGLVKFTGLELAAAQTVKMVLTGMNLPIVTEDITPSI